MSRISLLLLFLIAQSFVFSRAHAYPEFIGYSYTTCMTCHYNGLGSGPLTDYGRAVWATEIASRTVFATSMSEDDIGAQSGFLGTYEMPTWLRPHVKYRGINIRTQPGSASQDNSNYYHMQADAGVTLQDPSQKYVAVLTMGRVVPPSQYGTAQTGLDRFLMREYYGRIGIGKTWWVYAGLMEKAFGLRNIDHSSYQRTYQGFNVRNNSTDGIAQSQGIIVHKVEEDWEVAANYFIGNPYDDQLYKQVGYSLTGEYSVSENHRLGGSLMRAKSDLLEKQLAALHYRQKVGERSALMLEMGLIQDQRTGAAATTGSYNLLQALLHLARGYNLKLTVERYNREFNNNQPEQWKWSTGLLIFPLPRLELRASAVNIRSISPTAASDDVWALEGQVHVSL